MPQITKIVITGGPCAGKTTAMSWIQNAFTQAGYTVLFVPETATEFISGGVAPWTCGTNLDYQKCQVRLQMEKERLFHQAAMTMPKDKILIVCDRGVMDNKAYMNDEEFAEVMEYVGGNAVELRDGYDAVFHLNTAAKGVLDAYTLANNAARIETPDEAVVLDDKLIAAWTGHPHLRIIDNATEFEAKMKRLIGEIASFLGEPGPMEVERKYLIEYPDLAWLESQPNCCRVECVQTYLKPTEEYELSVRKRGIDGSYVYYETNRRKKAGMERIMTEQRLTEDEYLTLLKEADPTKHPICKERYCLTYDSQYFEIDVYPFWKDRAVVEIELPDEETAVRFPREFKVIREVTGEKEYENTALASRKES